MKNIYETILIGVMLIVIITLILNMIGNFIKLDYAKMNLTYAKCCNNSICSDTYYTEEDNKCHLSLCEHMIIYKNKTQCIYDGV
jgi:hypothetical protein